MLQQAFCYHAAWKRTLVTLQPDCRMPITKVKIIYVRIHVELRIINHVRWFADEEILVVIAEFLISARLIVVGNLNLNDKNMQ